MPTKDWCNVGADWNAVRARSTRLDFYPLHSTSSWIPNVKYGPPFLTNIPYCNGTSKPSIPPTLEIHFIDLAFKCNIDEILRGNYPPAFLPSYTITPYRNIHVLTYIQGPPQHQFQYQPFTPETLSLKFQDQS